MSGNTTDAPPAARLSYVYAVGRDIPGLTGAAARLTGVDGRAVRTVASGGLAAAVSSVPGPDFDEAGLRTRLEDLGRLEALARSHHTVVDALAARTTVLPLRLATVYLDDERVALMLRQTAEEFASLLDRLDGQEEWGVKIYVAPQAGTAAELPRPRPAALRDGAANPGRAYLQQRRAQRARQQAADRAVGDAVRRVNAAAAALATAHRAYRPQQGGPAEPTDQGRNIANDAYLVPVDSGTRFRAAVEEAAPDLPDVHVRLTGPWAPYSFSAAPAASSAGQAEEHRVSG